MESTRFAGRIRVENFFLYILILHFLLIILIYIYGSFLVGFVLSGLHVGLEKFIAWGTSLCL